MAGSVCQIVHKNHQCSDSGEIAGPGEADKDDCDDVMSQHLVEVLASGLQEMRNRHTIVEPQRYHVVPPDFVVELVRELQKHVFDIVQPDLVIAHKKAKSHNEGVEAQLPQGLQTLGVRVDSVHRQTCSEPSLHLSVVVPRCLHRALVNHPFRNSVFVSSVRGFQDGVWNDISGSHVPDAEMGY